jgi:predicted ATPase
MEAINHLRTGLTLLQTLPETPERLHRAVDMHIALGASLSATKGNAAPEVGQTYTDAQQRCEPLDDPHQLFPIVRGLWNYYQVRAEYQTAHALGEQLLTLAQHTQHPGMLLAAYRAVGTTFFYLGVAASALTHLRQGLALYDPHQHRASVFLYGDDSGVVCCSHAAWTLWCLGYPDQALARSQEAVTLAQQSPHPVSLSHILCAAARFHQFRREVSDVQEHAEATIRVAQEQGFLLWMAVGSLIRGWALVQQGQVKEGIEQLNQGFIAFRATGAEINQSYFLGLLAEAYGTTGQPAAGRAVLAEALTHIDKTGERWYAPELYRLKGALLLQQSSDNQVEAESCFQHAIAIAQSQQAKSWELRAATSLARLWQQQRKRQEAYDLLAPIYGWFTEGFDTADLQEAKALLETLA